MNYWLLFLPFILSLVFCPIIIAICKKFGWYDEIDPRKIHTGNIPRMGGVAVFLSFFTVFIIAVIRFGNVDLINFIPIIIGGAVIFVAGVLDDFVNLHARVKFAIQIFAAVCASLGPCYIGKFFGIDMHWLLGKSLSFIWVLVLVNAYNLIDGLDLLCGGLSFISFCTIGLVYILCGDVFWGFLVFSLALAVLGFLFWNKPKAKIFLGDGGSQSLGYFIAVFPLFPSNNVEFESGKFIVCLLLSSIPVIDVAAAIIRRIREKRSLFSADRAHLHHKLINIGFSNVTAALFLNFMQLVISSVILFAVLCKPRFGMIYLVGAYLLILLFFSVVHYRNRYVNAHNEGHLEDHPQKEH